MKDYQHHIRHPHDVDHPGKSICGKDVRNEWCFVDIGHAFLSAPKDYNQPCPKCAAAIVKVFSECE